MSSRASLSSQDMAASRLVFVSVKGAVPRRKVAVPVHEAATWDSFLGDVAAKLRLDGGVGALYLAATGEVVDRLDTLQDIDELFAEPAGGRAASGVSAGTSAGRAGAPSSAFAIVNGAGGSDDEGGGGGGKYEKRQSAARLALGRLFPSLLPAASSLPLTRQDLAPGGGSRAGLRGGRRRSRGGGTEGDRSGRLTLLLLAVLAGGLLVGAWWMTSQGASGAAGAGRAAADSLGAALAGAGDAVAAAAGNVAHSAGSVFAVPPPPPIVP